MKPHVRCGLTAAATALLAAGCSAPAPTRAFPSPIAVTLHEGVCDTISNTHRCAQAIEALQLVASGSLAWRDARGIWFEADRGYICVPHDTVGGWPSWFSYLGTLAEPPYHVLWQQYHEGNGVLLVNVASGTRVPVDALPVASPDGRFVVVASLDLDAAYNPNRIAIYRSVGDSLMREWSLAPTDWGPGAPIWIDSATVQVPRVTTDWTRGYEESILGTLTVVRRNGAWEVMSDE